MKYWKNQFDEIIDIENIKKAFYDIAVLSQKAFLIYSIFAFIFTADPYLFSSIPYRQYFSYDRQKLSYHRKISAA